MSRHGEKEEEGGSAGCSGNVLMRQLSRASVCDDSEDEGSSSLADGHLGPLVPLREHLERDKDDASLRRWKEQLLGSLEPSYNGRLEPEVKLQTLTLITQGRADVDIPLPLVANSRGYTFTLKEGCTYTFKLTFKVLHNLVSGLVHTNTVWKNGTRVDQMRKMLGTFAPQPAPYTHVLEEETTPSGALARGAYTAKMKFVDDDKRCYLDLNYTFELRKDWE